MVYGSYQIDGRGRPTEDRIVIHKLSDHCSLFAVFDGHSGSGVVRLTVELLSKRIQEALRAAGEEATLKSGPAMQALLRKAFLEHDKELARQMNRSRDSGSTASVALVTATHVIVAYIGDSPAFLMDPRSGLILKEAGKHEPTLATETERIRRAGGTVEIDEMGTPRVDGSLMVSRAFGDFSLKFDETKPPPFEADWTKMKITADPDVVLWERPEYGLLAIMSDGFVETSTSTLKPTAQVAHDIHAALKTNGYNLLSTCEAVAKTHVAVSNVENKSVVYDGDDLSLILVDVGKKDVQKEHYIAGGEERAGQILAKFFADRVKTRKMRGGRRNKTGKKNRIIKIMGI